MPKKTLITKMFTDVSDLSENMIELQKAFIRVAMGNNRVEFEVIVEDTEADNATAERLLRLVRSEFKEHDEQPRKDDDLPVIRIENNGNVLSFDVGKGSDDNEASQGHPGGD